MDVQRYHIEGVFSFRPKIFADERGAFIETWNETAFNEICGQNIHFVQDNQSISKKNVVRGLHFQIPPFAQAKLVRVLKGRVIDVAVDLRKKSPTYGQHIAIELTGDNNTVFFIPEGFAHGFSVLEDHTVFAYKCSNFYSKNHEQSILWNDLDLKIDWKISQAILSNKDLSCSSFKSFNSPF